MKKTACLFPGIGYNCDKPLMYYSGKMLKSLGWEIIPVPYTGFPDKVKGNPEKMRQCALMALEKAEEILKDVSWSDRDRILLIGKSVGTAACAAYAQRHRLPCRQVLFTPVEDTFLNEIKDAVVFHGTGDPWADTAVIREKCRLMGLPLYETVGANHSLETGDTGFDINNLKNTMMIVKAYAEKE